MVMEIPGFYYDEAKKKYFKIENNSSNHQYNSNSLKHKREEEEQINSKVSKLKLDKLQALPFIQSKILNIRNKYSYSSPNLIRRDYTNYIYSCLELRRQNKNLPVELNSNSNFRTKIDRLSIDNFGTDSESLYISQGLNISLYSRELGDDQIRHIAGYLVGRILPNNQLISTNCQLTSTSLSDDDVLYSTYVDINTGQSFLHNVKYVDHHIWDYHSEKKHYMELPEVLYGCKTNENNDIFTFGSESISVLMPDRGTITSLKTNGIDALSLACQGYVNYIGFRDGSIKLWDIRTSKLESIESNFKTSIINMEMIYDRYDMVISNIGSTVGLYDVRMGFKTSKVEYNSIKNVQDIFNESIKWTSENHQFLISNKDSVELFDVNQPNALKTISTFNDPITASYIGPFQHDKTPLFLFRGQDYDVYGL